MFFGLATALGSVWMIGLWLDISKRSSDELKARRDDDAKWNVPTGLQLKSVKFMPSDMSPNAYAMTAVATNYTDKTVEALEIEAVARDCLAAVNASRCIVVGQSKMFVPVRIAPNETKSITGLASATSLSADNLVWRHQLTNVRVQQ